MKKILLAVALLLTIATSAFASKDKAITFNQLPGKAQTFIKSYFAKVDVSFAKMDKEIFDTEYKVLLTDGTKLEFDGNGEWKSVDCRYADVPGDIVPQQIRKLVEQKYPGTKIIKIEKEDRGRIEVKISNRFKLEFDSLYRLIDMDD